MADTFDDSLDDLLGGPISDRPRATPPESYRPPSFDSICGKCGGSGRFVSYAGRDCGPCFTCKGQGKRTFKTPETARSRNRVNAAANKAAKLADRFESFKAAEPAVYAWIQAECARPAPFAFAMAMADSLANYGELTDRQLETCKRLVAQKAERQAERLSKAANAPAVDSAGIDRLRSAFDSAAAYIAAKGLSRKTPKITLGAAVISPAPAGGANAGGFYVKSTDREYLGKITAGRFHGTAACDSEMEKQILAFVANPEAAATVYGQETGTCCVCNATLRSEWRLRGIGPICAEKFGWSP